MSMTGCLAVTNVLSIIKHEIKGGGGREPPLSSEPDIYFILFLDHSIKDEGYLQLAQIYKRQISVGFKDY